MIRNCVKAGPDSGGVFRAAQNEDFFFKTLLPTLILVKTHLNTFPAKFYEI